MGESIKHMELVEIAAEFAKNLVPKNSENQIMIDSPTEFDKPPLIFDEARPDVYYKFQNKLIIGEAKTSNDFETPHSKNQFLLYLNYCEKFDGNAILISTVPWDIFITAINFFKRLKLKSFKTVRIFVVNELKRVEEI